MTFQYGRHGVDVGLTSMRTTPDIFWSDRGNSFVTVRPEPDMRGEWIQPDGSRVDLLSINGMGEVRWQVFTWGADLGEGAVEHFGLSS